MRKEIIGNAALYLGDCLEVLRTLPEESVQCVVTSPPYWQQRDYKVKGQLGLEKTPGEYVGKVTVIFEEIHRILKKDGTVWLNIGDTYTTGKVKCFTNGRNDLNFSNNQKRKVPEGFKTKELVGIPWRVAFALQTQGWYLRSDIIWSKTNPMPNSATDRPSVSHEYIFLLTKSSQYYYAADLIREPSGPERVPGKNSDLRQKKHIPGNKQEGFGEGYKMQEKWNHPNGRNKRTVWSVATQALPEAHYATFPEKLIEPCVLAGCPECETVLDPFNGSGTTGVVSVKNQRKYIGIDLHPDYIAMSAKRLEEAQRQISLFEASP